MSSKIIVMCFALSLGVVVFLAHISSTEASQVIPDGLVLYWPFDEETIQGDVIKDVVGENEGTLVGAPGAVEGKFGSGLELDGVDDFVTFPEILLGDFTIEAWFNASRAPGMWSRVFDGGIGSPGDVFITPNHGRTGGDLGFAIHASGGALNEFGSGVIVTPGEWYHVAATYDKDGEGMKLYVNGDLKGSNGYNAESFEDWAVPQNWYIGKANWDDPLFPGIIDEFRIYERPLDEDEIKQNMEALSLAVDHAGRLIGVWGAEDLRLAYSLAAHTQW